VKLGRSIDTNSVESRSAEERKHYFTRFGWICFSRWRKVPYVHQFSN